MEAKLIAIAGPLISRVYPIDGDLVVGRDSECDVCVEMVSVSRKHFVIYRHDGQYVLRDEGSRNGTFVNDVPVVERVLVHGDRIAVPGSKFVFSSAETADAQPERIEIVHFDVDKTPTITVKVADAPAFGSRYSIPDETAKRLIRTSATLLRINSTLAESRDPQAVQRSIAEAALEVISADRTVVLLLDAQLRPESVLGLRKGGDEIREFELSDSFVRRVMAGSAVLVSDVKQNLDLEQAPSIVRAGSRSLLGAPLLAKDKKLGMIYLDVCSSGVQFDRTDLEILVAIAGIGGLALSNSFHFQALRRQAELLRHETERENSMIGETPAMKAVARLIARVAPTDTTVLLLGESGTGKELASRAIHRQSKRADKPFVAINCATLSENLLESELFGHEKGAFTGAVAIKRGQLEVADGGTVFLDEVGELPMNVQAKFLRVLQEREFMRLGGTRQICTDIRVIAATNRDLRQAVKAGAFREDLWHRLNVVGINLPPLREHREDIALLANYFIAKLGKKCARAVSGLSAEAKAMLMSYDWPGNVRELHNAIERSVVMGEETEIQAQDLPESVRDNASMGGSHSKSAYECALTSMKQKLIAEAVQSANGNIAEASRRLGIHPTYVRRLIRTLGIRISPEASGPGL